MIAREGRTPLRQDPNQLALLDKWAEMVIRQTDQADRTADRGINEVCAGIRV